ncbi:DUF3558 domain-containing protein [Nocardia sp. NPDC050697]|uniref:DUF3558 domain-containing protein n=1 Tax=Nocardia sp. NPDC050697 TaxID=3155158 RepID=UPI0033D4ECD4
MRNGLRRGGAALAATLALTAALSGCGREITGTPMGVGESQPVDTRLDKLLRECDILSHEQIGAAVGDGVTAEDSFFGAVCMWDLIGAPGGDGMATLNWYENGSLGNEKQTNNKLGYTTENVTVDSALVLQIRRPNDPDSCGMVASAPDQGVIGWWLNYRAGSSHPDPCESVRKLMALTLNLAR